MQRIVRKRLLDLWSSELRDTRRNFIFGGISFATLFSPVMWSQQKAKGNEVLPGLRRKGEFSDTARLQRAIDEAHRRGGGTVYIPAGRYVSGSLCLRSHVTIWLGDGTKLVMSKEPREFLSPEKLDYDPKANFATSNFHVALLVGDGVENISVAGPGEIDCEYTKGGGPKPIALRRCRNVTIRDLTIRNSPSYNVSLLGCEFVTIDNITIRNGLSDGIDPDCCRYVRISNCFIESYDDAIVLKSSDALGELKSTEFVTIENCILRTASIYFKCGTESCGDFQDITISNCAFEGGMGMRHGNPGLAFYTVDGGTLANIVATGIVMRDVGTPIAILRGNRDRCHLAAGPGSLASIRISNVVASDAKLPSVIAGLPDAPVVGISLSGLRINMAASVKGSSDLLAVPERPGSYPEPIMFGELPCYGFFIRHAEEIDLSDIRIQSSHNEMLPVMAADDVVDLRLARFQSDRSESTTQLWLNNARNSSFELTDQLSCRISGSKSAALRFFGASREVLRHLVYRDSDVRDDVIQS